MKPLEDNSSSKVAKKYQVPVNGDSSDIAPVETGELLMAASDRAGALPLTHRDLTVAVNKAGSGRSKRPVTSAVFSLANVQNSCQTLEERLSDRINGLTTEDLLMHREDP